MQTTPPKPSIAMNEQRKPVALLVEDEARIRRFVRAALEDEGWQVFEAADCRQGLIAAGTREPDLVVLDLGLPDGDGVAFIADLRQWSRAALIVLSARTLESEKVRALDAGADDYLVKPFGVAELLARARSALRRQQRPAASQGSGGGSVVRFGTVAIDLQGHAVTRDGQGVRLAPTEFKLLAALARNAGRVVSNPQLLREVWGQQSTNSPHYLRIYMGHLRRKLEDDPAQPKYLITETGVGYRLAIPI
jgi:two-component system KDP operon response regulator KdpE